VQKKELPWIEPIRPVRWADAFDNLEWIYELKYDGFRALAYAESEHPCLISRNRNEMSRFANLAEGVAKELRVGDVILDGEIVCIDKSRRPLFHDLFFRRGLPMYYAFDLLWLDGKDLRVLPHHDRKASSKSCCRVAPRTSDMSSIGPGRAKHYSSKSRSTTWKESLRSALMRATPATRPGTRSRTRNIRKLRPQRNVWALPKSWRGVVNNSLFNWISVPSSRQGINEAPSLTEPA
jgi:ATP dependent DNA ligase-like protein